MAVLSSSEARRARAAKHASRSHTCVCGRVCHGNGGWSSHKRACAALAEVRAQRLRPKQTDAPGAGQGTGPAEAKGKHTVGWQDLEDLRPETLAAERQLNARRYEQLRILGCAPAGTSQLASGTVLAFTNLDEFIDASLTTQSPRATWWRSAPPEQLSACRYEHLRALGCAPSTSDHLAKGVVLTFDTLDRFVDQDLRWQPSRGEAHRDEAANADGGPANCEAAP